MKPIAVLILLPQKSLRDLCCDLLQNAGLIEGVDFTLFDDHAKVESEIVEGTYQLLILGTQFLESDKFGTETYLIEGFVRRMKSQNPALKTGWFSFLSWSSPHDGLFDHLIPKTSTALFDGLIKVVLEHIGLR